MSRQTYTVILESVQEHIYSIPDCNSNEEAEAIAERLFEEGEMGDVSTIDLSVSGSTGEQE